MKYIVLFNISFDRLKETSYLYHLASQNIYDGIRQDLLGPLTQVASILNAHGLSNRLETSSINKRALARENILYTLDYIPFRDEVGFFFSGMLLLHFSLLRYH